MHPLLSSLASVGLASLAGAADGKTIARFDLEAPGHSPFVLHGTLPVPKGTWPRADGLSPFAIASHAPGRPLVPAQVEIVSRYPTGEADVIELAARVELAKDEHENTPISFQVVLGEPHERTPLAVPARVSALLAPDAHRLRLRAHDVFGNEYEADLCGDEKSPSFGSLRVLANGSALRERRVYSTLVPAGTGHADGAPLPHLMGAHAYFREEAGEEFVRLDLRVNNGATAGTHTPSTLEIPLQAIYWRELELLVPKDWTLVPEARDPFFGEPRDEGEWRAWPIVAQLADGKLHLMPPQAQFERRFVLVPRGQEALAKDTLRGDGLGFCGRGEGLWSWFEPATARYFPERDLLASVDFYRHGDKSGKAAVRAMETAEMESYKRALETGTPSGWYTVANVMGWCHPWFVSAQGGVGGEGIATIEGQYVAGAASREGYQHLEFLHRMNVCRQSEAAYDGRGDVVGYHQWLDAEGRIPFEFRLNGGIRAPCFLLPSYWGPAASAQVLEVIKRDLRPPYDMGNWYEKEGKTPDRPDNLLAWWPHDDQHMVRYTKNSKALVWLGNDSMAKDDLLLSGELFRLMWHESPHIAASWSSGVSLKVTEGVVAQFPHQGAWVGREHAWGIDSMCAAYSVASPEWRARNRSWFDHASQLLYDASMPSGLIQRFINERLLGDNRYAVAQTFECLLLIHAIRCMNESVFRGVDERRRTSMETVCIKGIDYLFWGPPWARIQSEWQPDPAHPTLFFQGPRQGIAISPNDNYASPPFCDKQKYGEHFLPADGLGGGVEFFHPWAALNYAQEITDASAGKGLENRYLKRALDCWIPHDSFQGLAHALEAQAADGSMDNSWNWIMLLGKLQSLGVR